MKKLKKNIRVKDSLILLILVIVGIWMVVVTFNEYAQEYIKTQDEHHIYLAESASRNVEMLLNMHESGMKSFEIRAIKAVRTWQETGNTEELEEMLQRSIMYKDEVTESILCLKDREIIVSTNGNKEYKIINKEKEQGLVFCKDKEEEIHLLYLSEKYGEMQYGVLMKPEQFYRRTIGIGERHDIRDEIIVLSDSDTGIVIFFYDGKTHLINVNTIEEASEREVWACYMNQQHGEPEEQCTFWKLKKEDNLSLRMITLPETGTINKNLSVGMIADYNHVVELLGQVRIKLVVYCSMVFASVVILIYIGTHLKSKNSQIRKELALLKQKNEITKELTQKNNELAHNQRLQVMGTMTSGIVHEFNNIIGLVDGYSMLLMDGLIDRDDAMFNYAVEIHNAAQRAKDATRQLSDLSKKKKTSEFETVSLGKLIEEVEQIVKPIVPENVIMTTKISEGDIAIKGNHTQLSQMFLNLIINAFHAMEKGGELEICLECTRTAARIRVKDTGKGMPEELKQHIFEPFFTTKESGQGTGLGLALVKQIVDAHRGEIKVESEEGKGTTFVILFPLS